MTMLMTRNINSNFCFIGQNRDWTKVQCCDGEQFDIENAKT